MKAMILAAGRGSRMGSISESTPKPLLRVEGKPLIVYLLESFKRSHITEIIINVSYKAQQICQTLGDGKAFGVDIQYSYEPTALETGGGILQALPLLGDEPFIAASADIWSTYPFASLNLPTEKLAHLIMVDNPVYHLTGDFVLQDNLLSLEGPNKLTYASMGIFHPELFKDCKPGVFRLTEVLLPAIREKKISGEHFSGDWFNVGTESEWLQLKNFIKTRSLPTSF